MWPAVALRWRFGGTRNAEVVVAFGVDWWSMVADGVDDDGPLHRHFPVSVCR